MRIYIYLRQLFIVRHHPPDMVGSSIPRFRAPFSAEFDPTERRELTMLLDTTEDEVSRVIVQREGIDTENERAATLRHELYLKHPSFFTAAAFYHRFDLLVSDSRYADETFFDCIVPQLLVPMTNRRIEALQSALLVQYQDRYTHPPISTIGHIFGVLYIDLEILTRMLTLANMRTNPSGRIQLENMDTVRRDTTHMDVGQLTNYLTSSFTGRPDFNLLPKPFWFA